MGSSPSSSSSGWPDALGSSDRGDESHGRLWSDSDDSWRPRLRHRPRRARGARPDLADPRRRRREPEPGRGQRRAAGHRQGVRRGPDRAQPRRRRLLARARGLGALLRRARRPLRAQADADPRHARWRSRPLCSPPSRPRSRSSSPRACSAGLRRAWPIPTTLALITALWSGPARTKSIALWSALGRRDLRARAAALGRPAHRVRLGLGLRRHAAARGGRPVHGVPVRPGARERGHRSGRQPRRHPLGPAGGDARAGDQLRAGADEGAVALGLGAVALAAARRVRDPPAPRVSRRSTTSTWPRRRIFWVAACAGIIVFGTLMGAMFVGQQFLQNVLDYSTLDAGLAILPAAALHGRGRAPLGQARGGARGPLHPADRLRRSACWASSRCCCCGRRTSPTGRSASDTP